MGLWVKISDEELQRRIAAMRNGLQDATPVMQNWGQIAAHSIAINFDVGGRPKWRPLSEVTIGLKELKHAPVPSRALYFRGYLREGVFYKEGRSSVVVSTSPNTKDYASIQQFGGNAGRNRKVKIPARPYIVLQEEDKGEMRETARRYLARLAASKG